MPHPDPWDEVSSLVVVGAGGRSLHGGPHSVLVVLTDKDAGQLPQRSHVERLKQLALVGSEQRGNPNADTTNLFIAQSGAHRNGGVYLIGCAVAVECDAHLVVSLVLAGQSNSSSQRNLDKSQPHFQDPK